jgi:SAM-dependent methyltransferase
MMMRKLRRLAAVAREHGTVSTLRWVADYLMDAGYEWRFSVGTAETASKESLGLDADANEYVPTSYSQFFRAMHRVPARGTFVDYGCGAGRIVLCAATLPFQRAIGIEVSNELVAAARNNLARTRRKLLCREVEFVAANAATWQPPDDVTVFYFFNPFFGDTLKATMQNIAASLRRAPREAWIVFGCPYHMHAIMAVGVIPLAWQRGTQDVLWPPHRERESSDPNAHRHRIYHLDSR